MELAFTGLHRLCGSMLDRWIGFEIRSVRLWRSASDRVRIRGPDEQWPDVEVPARPST
jgi:hypothetical protein